MKSLKSFVALTVLFVTPFLGDEDFWRKFMPAYTAGDTDAMKKLVGLDPQGAIDNFLFKMEKFSVEMDDEMGKQIDALKTAWSNAYHNNFFENEYKYLSLIDSSIRKRRTELLNQWRRLQALFNQTKNKVDDNSWQDLERNLPILSEGFEQIGDLYYAALGRYVLGQTYDPTYRFGGKGGNPRTALDNYKKCMELRERLDFKDSFYNGVKVVADRLEKLYQAATPTNGDSGGGGSAEPVPFKAGSDWQKIHLAPAKGEVSNEVEHFGYDFDDLLTTWIKIQSVKMAPVQLPNFSSKVQFVQEGPAKFGIDQNGDGKGDIPVKAVGKPELVEFTRDLGNNQTDTYAIWITNGTDREVVQRIETNVAPTKELSTFFYRSAAVRTGDVLGVPFKIFDDNADGKFTLDRVERTMEGSKNPIPVIDSWIFGKEKRVTPVSAYVPIADKWYKVELDEKTHGKEMKVREVEVKESSLVLQYKGPPAAKPNFFIVRAIGSYEGAYFDIASGKPVKVPAGGYEIFYGLMRSGKGKQAQKMAILKGTSKMYIAEPGKPTTITIGEPFSFDFQVVAAADKLVLKGETVAVTGSAGERYELIWDEILLPEFQARAGNKPFGKPAETKRATQADLTKTNDWGILWHPMDVELEAPAKTTEKIQFKLSQKHKWFGKIESDWK